MTQTQQFSLALAQMNPTVGDLAGNAAKIVQLAKDAAAQGADLVLYPEMAITGYPPEDLVLVGGFRSAAMETAKQIAKDTAQLSCDLLIGGLWYEKEHTYNALLLASKGKLSLVRVKYDLPNYGVFDEKRVFDTAAPPQVVEWRGIKLGLLICEEVWDADLAKLLAGQGAEILLVPNASPYHLGKAAMRKQVVSEAVKVTGLPLVYVNLVGGQDELVFDGRSYAVGADGKDIAWLPGFTESLALLEWKKNAKGWQCIKAPMAHDLSNEETIYRALVLALRDYVSKNNFPGVVLGLSGGIDSALTAAIAVDALGAGKVRGLLLPSPYTSKNSIDDAQGLAAALGILLETVPITPAMEAVNASLKDLFKGKKADTTEENIQARLRGLLLMAASNKFGPMVLTTGNKSEMSVGYATLYGDMCGGFSVLKDVYKTTVYKLSEWRNAHWVADFQGPKGAVIPKNSISKPPTAELRDNQKDQDSLPPYDVLDTILRGLIERQLSVKELAAEGMDKAMVEKVARMVWAAEYKRRQSAPGVKITPMAFGRDRRWPITNAWRFE